MLIREFLVRVPLIGGIAYCRWRDLARTIEELIPKLAIGSLPIIFSCVILRFGKDPILFPSALAKNFENGELYLFCTSMLASIFYIAVKERGDNKPGFPNRLTHLLFVVIMIATSSVIFAMSRAGVVLDPVLMIDLSYWFFLVTLLMIILATTINNGLNSPNPITFQKKETANFLEKMKAHRGENE